MDNSPRITTAPSQTILRTVRRSTTGENYPGTPVNTTTPSYTSQYEWLRDGTGLRSYNKCEHYQRWCTLDRPWTDGADTWYSTGTPALGFWEQNYADTISCWNGAWYNVPPVDASYEYGNWEYPVTGLPLLYVDDASGRYINLPDSVVVESLIDRSLNAMLPGIKPSLSVLNTIAELRDIKSAGRTIGRINEALGSVERLKEALGKSKQVVKLLSGVSRRKLAAASLRSVTQSGADLYLQGQFNVGPLLRDISGLSAAISSARSQLNQLIAGAGRTQKKRFRISLRDHYVNSNQSRSLPLPTFFVPAMTTCQRQVTYPTAMFCATMEYAYRMPYLLPVEDYLSAAVHDVLGANWNPSILWNAVPWTFVVDWVFGVSRWLDQFKTRNIEPVVSISRYGYSIHVQRHIVVSHGLGAGAVPFARIDEEAYFRTPHSPDWYRSIESSGLNPREFSLAAALALSR